MRRVFSRAWWRKGKDGPAVLDVRAGYALWADGYPPHAHNPLMEAEERAMLELLPDPSGKACLDVACGTGRYIRILRERHARAVVGVDYSFDMLRQGRRHLPGLSVAQGHFMHLPFPSGAFDLVTCALAVAYERSLSRVLAEAARVLRPGGSLIYSDRHPFRTLSGTPRHSCPGRRGAVDIEHHLHLFEDHVRACREAGLSVERVLEPSLATDLSAGGGPRPVILAVLGVKGRPSGESGSGS
ncbi:MAG: class I SAM-dependent methyltransferase [Thermoanaerobaculia bacterium]